MSLDLTLLQTLRTREKFEKLARSVPKRALDTVTAQLLVDFGAYFAENPGAPSIQTAPFLVWACAGRYRTKPDETIAKYRLVLDKVQQDPDPFVAEGLIRKLAEAALAADITEAAAKFSDGEEIHLPAAVSAAHQEYERFSGSEGDSPDIGCDIEALLAEEKDDTGISFRLNCLNLSMRKMRAGDFILFAARPDRGKGTFIASEATCWAPQVLHEFGPDRPIVICVNEGPGRRVWERLYCAALGTDIGGLLERQAAGTLRRDYAAALGGDERSIRIVNIHGDDAGTVERKLSRLKPSIFILDMLANIRWAGSGTNGGTRSDQIIEALAQWAREYAVKHDAVGWGTVQLSAEAEGVPFPPMSAMKDSKTGLQGANDAIIFAGASNDPMLATSRYISCVKNKLRRLGAPGNPMAEVLFDAAKARYCDIAT